MPVNSYFNFIGGLKPQYPRTEPTHAFAKSHLPCLFMRGAYWTAKFCYNIESVHCIETGSLPYSQRLHGASAPPPLLQHVFLYLAAPVPPV